MGQIAWLAGATGLVGREALKALLEDPDIERVITVVRRPGAPSHPKLEERVVDFDALEPALAGLHADVALCCLGTTIKQAGSRDKFRRVDHDYVLAFARAARLASAKHFLVVTALGADARSSVFYNVTPPRKTSCQPPTARGILAGCASGPGVRPGRHEPRWPVQSARKFPAAVRGHRG